MQPPVLLDAIDQQCRMIARRVLDDIETNIRKTDPAGFVSYPMLDQNKNLLTEAALTASGLSLQSIEGSIGYQKILAICDRKYFRLALENHLDFDRPDQPRALRLTVDGW